MSQTSWNPYERIECIVQPWLDHENRIMAAGFRFFLTDKAPYDPLDFSQEIKARMLDFLAQAQLVPDPDFSMDCNVQTRRLFDPETQPPLRGHALTITVVAPYLPAGRAGPVAYRT